MADFDPSQPYNDLPPLPPEGINLESRSVLKACIDARVALAELKQAADLIPNAAVLVNALPLLEARASSEIENIVTTTDKLFEFMGMAEERADAATKEALRYRSALAEGSKMVRRRMLTTDMAIHICSTIKDMELDIRADSGAQLRNRLSGSVIYTPPEGQKRLQVMLDDWAQFMHSRTEIDPLIRMAAQHYQFEAIHPFADGNGRTGRILNILFLMEQGLLDSPILYLSRYIIGNKLEYYRLLLKVTREAAWEDWLLFMLNGIHETCSWTTDKIKAIRELMEHTSRYVQAKLPKTYSWELVEALFKQPYCRIHNLVTANIAKRQTASVYLKQLCDIGVLLEHKSGRETLFVHPKYIELLTGEENVWVYYDDEVEA
ncbi:MAG: Fic family protein [Pseudomonadota bacterium]